MKAAVFYGKEDLRVEEVAAPTPRTGQVKLRVGYAGICGSDLHTYFHPDANPFISSVPHPLTGAHLPQVLGHELSGTIVELGDDVDALTIGDRGAVFPIVATCGECPSCLSGVPFTCRLLAALGTNTECGGLSEFVTIDAVNFHQLPENVDLRMGALVEPLAVGWHGVARTKIRAGGTALVVGAGPVGIGAWYAFRAHGIENVLVSEPNADRRAAIAALGARVVDPVREDLAAAVAVMTGRAGVEAVVEAAGTAAAFNSGLASLAPGGRLSVVAAYEKSVEFQPTMVSLAETEIVGSVGYEHADFDGIIEAMSRGVYDTSGWVAERELVDVAEAIRSLRDGSGTKVLIRID